jgi:hypothetical protein
MKKIHVENKKPYRVLINIKAFFSRLYQSTNFRLVVVVNGPPALIKPSTAINKDSALHLLPTPHFSQE